MSDSQGQRRTLEELVVSTRKLAALVEELQSSRDPDLREAVGRAKEMLRDILARHPEVPRTVIRSWNGVEI